jgi:hypothetical protein
VPKGTPINLGISDETGPINTFLTGPSFPNRLAIDSAGNLYIANRGDETVWQFSARTGRPTVLAGTSGVQGHTGDGGPAASAELNGPVAVAVDQAGNVYISELGGLGLPDIRKVTPGGIITTLATFTVAYDLKFSGSTLYLVGGPTASSMSPCTVDTLNTVSGAITRVVGNPFSCADSPTTLDLPRSVTFDQAGAMYITEVTSHVIRKYQGGVLTTIAGTGTGGYAGDGGPATSAQLNTPDDIAIDSSGDLFFTDPGNDVVREITPDGTIQTMAGTGTGGSSGDGGPANKAQFQFFCDNSFAQATGIAIDGADHLYVSDTCNGRIREIT